MSEAKKTPKTVLKKDYDKKCRELKDFQEIALKLEKDVADLKHKKEDFDLEVMSLRKTHNERTVRLNQLGTIIVQLNLEKYLDD